MCPQMRLKAPALLAAAATLAATCVLLPTVSWATAQPWQIGQQAPATPIMERVHSFHDMLMWIISAIVIFVLALLVYACWRFAEGRNPVPSRRSHHPTLEVIWTVVPVLILVIIAIPSFKLLYFVDVEPETELTIKATGHQWYWSYTYPDSGNFTFDANMIADSDLQDGQLRLLETDNRVVVPVGTNVRIQTTADDVIHSWAVPQFGVKVDAVPGRLNQLWISVERPGVYYGQCSELCGINHGFMPITVEAKTREDFDAWVAEAKTKFARADEAPVKVAGAATMMAQPAQ
jgi:cytochrome c oxidase subunit II